MARPREFEPAEALDAITETFWSRGFDGTSLQDLVEATGLKKGSLYAAFGDKRAMYHAALRNYDSQEITKAVESLRRPGSPKERIARLFDAVLAAGPSAKGCLICNASIDQAPLDRAAREMLAVSIARMENAVVQALGAQALGGQTLRGQTLGGQALGGGAERLRQARGILASYFGLRVLAKSGAEEGLLRAVRDEVLAGIP